MTLKVYIGALFEALRMRGASVVLPQLARDNSC